MRLGAATEKGIMAINAEPMNEDMAVEIDMASGAEASMEPDDLDIPELSAPEFGSKGRTSDQSDLFNDGDSEEDVIAKAEKARDSKQKKQKEPKIKSPDARARILQKEKQEKDREVQDLKIKVERLYEAMMEMSAAGRVDPQIEEDEIDPELDPQGAQAKQLERLQQDIERMEYERELERTTSAVREATIAANKMIQTYVQSDESNQDALQFLAGIVEQRADDVLPNYTTAEKVAAVGQWMNEQKVQWIAEGKHPGKQMVEMAYAYGFNPDNQYSDDEEFVEEPLVQDVNRQKIAQARAKQSKASTISDISGRAPNRMTGEELKKMDSDTFNRTVDKMIKAGQWNPNNSLGRTPSLSQLLPGKGIQV